MRKIILALFVFTLMFTAALTFAVPVKGNETNEANWSDITYQQVPVFKVLESKEALIVTYQTSGLKKARVTIPKKWAHGTVDEPRKLKFRDLSPGKLKPFMTIVRKGGEFQRVILTISMDKRNEIWGMVKTGAEPSDLDKETLELDL